MESVQIDDGWTPSNVDMATTTKTYYRWALPIWDWLPRAEFGESAWRDLSVQYKCVILPENK